MRRDITGEPVLSEGDEADSGVEDADEPSEAREPRKAAASAHVLVVSSRDDEPAQLGLPIDRVIGLVDGPRTRRGGRRLIVERRPVEGRVVSVLDPVRLVERATEIIAGVG